MKKKFYCVISIVAIVIIIISMSNVVEAKIGSIVCDSEGRYFSSETGYFQVRSKTYYAHKTKSQMYEVGELATNTYRVRNNKMYYFGRDGAMITHKSSRNRNTRYMDFNKDGSIHYIYPAGRRASDERYNANRRRFQFFKNGKWHDIGMQCWPYGWIDWQE